MANKTVRQKKLGPAPFASFEDSFDDLSSPESKGYQPMPEICEERYQQTDNNNDVSASTSTAQTPTTPRIDVEQASSPSQGESDDSTPERELFGLDMAADKLTSAFLEGAADVDLRSSAEGMGIPYSSDCSKGRLSRNSSLLATGKSTPVSRRDTGQQQVVEAQHRGNPLERRGSMGRNNGNNVTDPFAFPCRETRLSSISSNVSATSGMSFLSAFSGRRSPSPHRMQLETSFCGPKTMASAAAREAAEDEELQDFDASRRPSLLNPSAWLGHGSSRCASPVGTPSSPGFMRASMFKYATEPRSRPTSPMGWNSAAPSPGASLTIAGEFPASSRWLVSPRCQRRSSSPHRTLVETSFCGHMQMKVPDDEVEPRGPSPMPSLGSLLSIQSQPVKYATEPRSRPASPTASKSYFSLTPVPTDSRRNSLVLPAGRCPSPMIETSFCGPRHLVRKDSKEDPSSLGEAPRAPSSFSMKPSETGGQEATTSLRPIKYATEPRSRPASPASSVQHAIVISASVCRTDSPILINRTARSPSPHRMRVETSFCGPKQIRQESMAGAKTDDPLAKEIESNVTEVSIHALPVKYATEPRSRPVSPCNMLSRNCPTPDPEIRAMRSPSPMMVETSFCGNKSSVKDDDIAINYQKVVNIGEPARPQSTIPVKYATEPRSRPSSPGLRLLSNHTTPVLDRRHRSPSPHRMLVETSFCGPKQMTRQESEIIEAVQSVCSRLQGRDQEEADDLSNSSGSVFELPIVRNHFNEQTIQSNSPSSSLLGAMAYDEKQEAAEFPTNWPDQPVSEFAATWPILHMSTFELSPEKKSRSSSEDTASPPSQRSNGHIVSMPPKASTVTASPIPVRSGRQMPKPVPCPKPPQSFIPQSDSSAQSSPLASPALSRRFESASPSPSSPFPSRRTSLGSSLRSNQGAEDVQTTDQPAREFNAKLIKSGDLSDESPHHSQPEKMDRKDGHKGRSVLSVLFGKRGGRSKLKDQDLEAVDEKSMMTSNQNGQQQESASRMLSLPLPSRDSSPGRSLGDSGQSGDDLDEADGFQHQVLDTGNESGDNLVESELDPVPALAPTSSNSPKEEISFFHQDSIEEELPFVPTTLPIERPIAPVITPVRMRTSEVKTTPTQRPRCSISFGPSSIGDYVKIARADSVVAEDPSGLATTPKIIVSLPKPEREESVDDLASTIPAVKVTVGSVCSNWEAFSEQVFMQSISSRKRFRQGSEEVLEKNGSQPSTPGETKPQQPPIPKSSQWVNVEELPEPVKEAKAIKVVKTSAIKEQTLQTVTDQETEEASGMTIGERTPEEDDVDKNLGLPVRKDSVSSETALLREIEEAELEEDRSPPADDGEASLLICQRHSQSSSLAELDSNLDEVEATELANSNLLSVAPFGMDLDVHSNRSSVVAPSEDIASSSPEDEEELPISTQ
ncbi:hypothetical protein OUZ56_005101 [Daphnia magna]|uniref:Uncharacterized protein n=1 Tax=Daphnia magna TaxID=35525 RepID=A0ABQ9YRU2_9CRUS|nr:hypothetical protein OUZ56_005101 [Daphnia magna]